MPPQSKITASGCMEPPPFTPVTGLTARRVGNMDMTYRPLGRSGLMVSAVGLGTNAFGRRVDPGRRGAKILDAAQGRGGDAGRHRRHLRRPTRAASEEMLGPGLHGRREGSYLATKFGMDMRAPTARTTAFAVAALRPTAWRRLRRLQTDHIDLYQLHFPDSVTPIAETLATLAEPIREGKVRYVGCSNFAGWQVADAAWTAEPRGSSRSCRCRTGTPCSTAPSRRGRSGGRGSVWRLPFSRWSTACSPASTTRGQRRRRWAHGPTSGPSRARLARPGRRLGPHRGTVQSYAEKAGSLVDVAIAGLAAQPAVASVIHRGHPR